MSNNKSIFPNMLKNPKIVRELIKKLIGYDPGFLEHLLLCGRHEQAYDANVNVNVDYSVFEDDSYNLYTIGIYYEPMYPEGGYINFLNDITTNYMNARYGYCPPTLDRTVVGLVPVPKAECCGENEFIIPMWEKQEDPAIAEMLAVLLEDEYEPVTELGKATQEYLISIWGENYWE